MLDDALPILHSLRQCSKLQDALHWVLSFSGSVFGRFQWSDTTHGSKIIWHACLECCQTFANVVGRRTWYHIRPRR